MKNVKHDRRDISTEYQKKKKQTQMEQFSFLFMKQFAHFLINIPHNSIDFFGSNFPFIKFKFCS